MIEYPDFHSFKSLEKYWSFREQLFTTKDPDEIENICWQMIKYIRPALDEQKQFNEQYKLAIKENAEYFGRDYQDRQETYFVTAEPFKRYAIVCEKKGNLPQAIWACQQAISLGLTDDGTKAGMKGRLEKLMKRYELCQE